CARRHRVDWYFDVW
nr:immunoglobulin heavy chain junction region [Mus musculus]